MSQIVLQAAIVAEMAHRSLPRKPENAVRKYTGEPYVVHCFEVALILTTFHAPDVVVAAALLHDVIEDTTLPVQHLTNLVGEHVTGLVLECTDVYTTENYPNLNRTKRKELERQRIANASIHAKAIKLADLISNTRSIIKHDVKFARTTYLPEKEALLPLLRPAHPLLWQHAYDSLVEAQQQLVQTALASR